MSNPPARLLGGCLTDLVARAIFFLVVVGGLAIFSILFVNQSPTSPEPVDRSCVLSNSDDTAQPVDCADPGAMRIVRSEPEDGCAVDEQKLITQGTTWCLEVANN